MSDFVLINQLKKGDKHAVRTWYALYAPKLRTFFLSKVRYTADADELVHDVFLSCLASLPLFRGETGLYGWMLSIARHELADYYRKLYAKKVIAALPLGEQLLETAINEVGDTHHIAKACLARLPANVAELLALKYIDKLSVEGIAEKFCVSPHVIQGRLYRARNAFRHLYDQVRDEYEKV